MEAQIGALILATDISRQNEYLSLFRAHLDRGDLCLEDARHRHLVLQVKRAWKGSISRANHVTLRLKMR